MLNFSELKFKSVNVIINYILSIIDFLTVSFEANDLFISWL